MSYISYRSYSTLGNNCRSQTVALTDNTKFISQYNKVYSRECTDMYKYPGHDNPILHQTHDEGNSHPEDIKAVLNDEKNTVSCKSCSTQ